MARRWRFFAVIGAGGNAESIGKKGQHGILAWCKFMG
jgi:hypothetical protein